MIVSKLKAINKRFYPQHLFYTPDWIVLGVNNVCNLHCKMCDVGIEYTASNFYQNLMGTSPLNMPVELIKKILDETAKHFPKTKIGYAFTEPLIYPHLIESLNYAKEKQLYTSITTNALTLKPKAKDLCDAGLNDIFVSLDGPETIHNEIRGNKNSYQKAIEGIEELLRQKYAPEISIFCVITEWNIGHLKKFIDYFKKFPIKQIGFMHTNFTSDLIVKRHNQIYGNKYPATISNTEQIEISQMNLTILLQEIIEIKKSNYPFEVIFSPQINDETKLDVFYNQPEKFIGKICNDVYRNIMIKSDGSVIPAHGRCYNLTVGNINNNSLKEIWNSKVISEFRKDLMDAGGLLPACSRCCSAF
ncbi:MAG: radical SAM protein [Ignavibacteriales bacterium]|nr:radical SAM protein [Ignavibacteriales bacterium]